MLTPLNLGYWKMVPQYMKPSNINKFSTRIEPLFFMDHLPCGSFTKICRIYTSTMLVDLIYTLKNTIKCMVVIGWLLDSSLGVFRAPLPHMQAKVISGRIPSALIWHELHTSIVTRMQPLSRPQAVTKGVHNLLLNHCDRLSPLEWGCSSKPLICALESLMCFLELVSETFNHTIRDNVAF